MSFEFFGSVWTRVKTRELIAFNICKDKGMRGMRGRLDLDDRVLIYRHSRQVCFIVVVEIAARKYKGNWVMAETLQAVRQIHGATAKLSIKLVQVDRKIQPSVARQFAEIVCVSSDVVDGEGTGN